jgi:hypothetical protein
MTLALCLCGLALGGYFKGKCPSDDAVIEWFHLNKKTLDDMLNMVAADDERVTYVGRGRVEARPGTSLPEARQQEYLRKLRDTGADHFSYQRNEGATVGLWTDATSITASSRYKDIQYIQDINKWRYMERLSPSLDGLERNGLEGIWLRHIEGKWYIVYMKG